MSLSTRVSGGKPQSFLYAEIVAGACQIQCQPPGIGVGALKKIHYLRTRI